MLRQGYTGYMVSLTDLKAPVSNWQVVGIPLTSLMDLEMRKGKEKPVIKKTLVDLKGPAFQTLRSRREAWKKEDHYCFPGPIQFYGPSYLVDQIPLIIQLK